ncbi:MAG: AEC family transporter [Actinomycetota bacterium]|nr:AEC family transporter [Actinomycetota bacterium]
MGAALLLLGCVVAGVAVQRARSSERLREATWIAYFWTIAPVLVYVVFRTVDVDRNLLLALGAAIAATWIVAVLSYAYAMLVSTSRDERGALALAAACPNTGFLGFPMAQLAFGSHGLQLAVLYDQLSWLVPATAVTTTVARTHGRRAGEAERPLRALLVNPPLVAMVVALVLRAAGWDLPLVDHLGTATSKAVGPVGFFLLGLSLPLEPPAHAGPELRRAGGALLIRFAGGPLVLYGVGKILGADVPGAFYLLAGMPCAFHLLILARVYDMRPALMRLLVVGSTVPAVVAVVLVAGLH